MKLKSGICFGLGILLLAISCKEPPVKEEKVNKTSFYVGTYTDGDSEGIYKYSIDADGKLEKSGLLARSENPSFLTKSKDGRFLLAVNEVSNENRVGYVSSFEIMADSLVLLDKKSSGGAHPCHIITNSEDYVVTANYTGGNMGLLQLKEDGMLSELLDVQQHEGKGGHERQDAPHAHSGWFGKQGELISVDLGTNQLWFSTIDTESGKFEPQNPANFTMEEGAGPRHLAMHPEQEWLYVVNELSSSVSLIKKDTDTGLYSIEQTISTLPSDFTNPNTCADIHISADGRFIYASNRGHNSIAIFELEDGSGRLIALGHRSTLGENPRNFTLSPANDFLLVANQTSNNILSFRRDPKTGELTYVDKIMAPTPVCLLF